jgi:hypothetical protein
MRAGLLMLEKVVKMEDTICLEEWLLAHIIESIEIFLSIL